MQRFIVLGDIHIGDYPRYNGVTNRLEQFSKLADRLCLKSGDDLDSASDVIIAGDLLLNCVMKPRVMHCVKEFIEKLSKRFDNVYYILGNHDVDIKLKRFNGADSFVTLFDSVTNFHYMHDKHLKVEDVDFYFLDWIHSDEIPLQDTSDIFISHINLMPRFGQVVDNKKFKLGIFGDYHARIEVDNMITTGTPIQHYISDPTEPGVVILDIDGDKFNWKRIPIETPQYKFLKIFKEENAPSPLGPFDVVVKARKVEKKPEFDKLKVSLDSKLDELLEERGLTKIHQNVLNVTGEMEPMDMNFTLKKLDVLNFRSIEDLHVKFDDGKLIFLSGHNGSGKTSIMTALRVALFGDRGIKKHIRKGCDYTEIGVELEYQGRTHSIVRAPGYLAYKINDVAQDANNMASLQSSIERNLPFLAYLGDFIIGSHTTFFSSCNRVGLISRLFGLDRYSMYSQEANRQKGELENQKRGLDLELARAKEAERVNADRLVELENQIPNIDSKYKDYTVESIEDEISGLRFKVGEIETNLGRLNGLHEVEIKPGEGQELIDSLNEQIDLNIKSIQENDKKIESLDNLKRYESQYNNLRELKDKSTHTTLCPKCGEVVSINLTSSEIENQIVDLRIRIEDLTASLVNVDRLTTLAKNEELKRANTELINKRENEKARLNDALIYTQTKEKCEKRINELLGNDTLESLKSKITELQGVSSKLGLKRALDASISSCKADLQKAADSKIELGNKIDNCNADLELYNRYMSTFSFSNLDGIPFQTLNMVMDTISDEDLIFTTAKELASGKIQFRVSCQFNVDGNYIDFDEISDGQQAAASMKILSKLTRCMPGLGLVMLDEPFKHVDEGNIGLCIQLLKNVQANHILISSHSPSFNYADRVLSFSLVDGVSVIREES